MNCLCDADHESMGMMLAMGGWGSERKGNNQNIASEKISWSCALRKILFPHIFQQNVLQAAL